MFQPPKKKMDDWMRIILLNWVMISMVMFYSILVGLIAGALFVAAAQGVLDFLGAGAGLLRVFPFSPAATAIVAATIAVIFLATFRALRFNCETGGYMLAVPRNIGRVLLRRAGAGIGVLAVSALAVRWLSGG